MTLGLTTETQSRFFQTARSAGANRRIQESVHSREGKAKSCAAGMVEENGAGFGHAKDLGRW